MARERDSNDDATGRRLWLLIGLVVVLATAVLGWAVTLLLSSAAQPPSLLLLLGLVLAVTFANRTIVVFRIRSNRRGISWTEVAVLAGLAVLPAPWVVLCTTIAVTASRLSSHTPFQKSIFGIAKETLVAATAGVVFLAAGVQPDPGRPVLHLGAIATAAVVMWIVDEALIAPVMTLATRTSFSQMMRSNWDLRVLSLIARYLVAVLVIGILALDGDARLLLLVPPLVFCIHLWQSGRLHSREERRSWQRLAETTDELNVVELSSVLSTAVMRAAELFSADEVEVELRRPGRDRLLRGTVNGITYDGPVTAAAPGTEHGGLVIPADLAGHDGNDPAGLLRLRFRAAVKLTESEEYKLKTFASALYTSIRNAIAYEELQRLNRQNAHAATHDPLTGLVNRRALLACIDETLAQRDTAGITALVLIDLNHFKEVNDTLGHATGDKVLQQVAQRLSAAAEPHELVARLGGDEFALLLTRLAAPAMASHRAEALLAALEPIVEVDGMRLTIEASGGIALAPGTGGHDELLRRADVAMYQAKRSDQRTSVYVHARDTADLGRLVLGGELSRAVADRDFVVDFQPIVDLNTGEAIAAEAVARWPHAGQPVDSRRLLSTIERSGLLPAFATAMLEQSLAAARAWRDGGFNLPVAVNVAPRSLLDPAYPASVLDRLAAHELPADRLSLELTETLTISQLDTVGRVLRELREAGVRLVLDDFGTGAGPLTVLSRLPVHELKIDPEFVRTVDSAAQVTAVVRSTMDLARSLHLTVVAEGVESEPQRQALWELGCTAGQGPLFARPMPPDRLLAALRRGHDGRPGAFAPTLHDAGAVIRMPHGRRRRGTLPHLPA